jgi:hypothetical protein
MRVSYTCFRREHGRVISLHSRTEGWDVSGWWRFSCYELYSISSRGWIAYQPGCLQIVGVSMISVDSTGPQRQPGSPGVQYESPLATGQFKNWLHERIV